MTEVQMCEDGDEIRFTVSEPEFDKFASDALQRLRDKQEDHLEEALKGMGWTSPDDLPAHNRKIAARTLREAAVEIEANADPMGDPDPAWLAGMESAASRVRDLADRIEQGGL